MLKGNQIDSEMFVYGDTRREVRNALGWSGNPSPKFLPAR